MAERLSAWLNVKADPVPDADAVSNAAWRDWCQSKGFDDLGKEGGRRAWMPQLSTYLRGAKWLIYADGLLIDTADEHDVATGRIAFKRADDVGADESAPEEANDA